MLGVFLHLLTFVSSCCLLSQYIFSKAERVVLGHYSVAVQHILQLITCHWHFYWSHIKITSWNVQPENNTSIFIFANKSTLFHTLLLTSLMQQLNTQEWLIRFFLSNHNRTYNRFVNITNTVFNLKWLLIKQKMKELIWLASLTDKWNYKDWIQVLQKRRVREE